MEFKNNTSRVIVAVLAIPLILAAVYFGKLFFLGFIGLITLISFNEFSKMIAKRYGKSNNFLGYLFVTFLLINSYFKLYEDYFVVFLIYTFLLSIFELFRNKDSAIENIGGTLLSSLYIGLAGASLILIREVNNSDYKVGFVYIIAMLVSIWACDSAAYYSGTAFGKHKLFPRVSPNKSWEGSFFGLAGAMVILCAATAFNFWDLTWEQTILIGLITGVIGQIGDLIESLFKRDAKVKDSSHILPGHGGIFDRFDSLFLSAPFLYIYLYLTSLIK